MNNNLVNQELMNIDLYNKLYYELENLPIEKKTPANIREELSKYVNMASSNRADLAATIAAFYYYSLNKKELYFLKNYYHKTFSACFNKQLISKYSNEIKSNKIILNSLLDICNSDITSLLNINHDTKKEFSKEKKDITSKMGSFPINLFNKLVEKINLRRLPANDKKIDNLVTKTTRCDKVASANKSIVEKLIKNSRSKVFISINDISNKKLEGIEKSFKNRKANKEEYQFVDPKSDVRLSNMKALGGTKVSTIKTEKSIKKVA